MSGELKFLSRLSKKADKPTHNKKDVLQLYKKKLKQTFLQLAKQGILHLSKRSPAPNLPNITLVGHNPLPYKKLDKSQGPSMTIRLSKKQATTLQQTISKLISNGIGLMFFCNHYFFLSFQTEICDCPEDLKILTSEFASHNAMKTQNDRLI
jgi:hypothetical protein